MNAPVKVSEPANVFRARFVSAPVLVIEAVNVRSVCLTYAPENVREPATAFPALLIKAPLKVSEPVNALLSAFLSVVPLKVRLPAVLAVLIAFV
jgi:hypothetical protein